MEDKVWHACERAQGEVAGIVRQMLGEQPIATSNINDDMRSRRVAAMKNLVNGGAQDPAERHQQWTQQHVDSCWVYGKEFNENEKTHPNLLPWDELPAEVKLKAEIFMVFARLAKSLEE